MKKTINRLSWNSEAFLKQNLDLIEKDNFEKFYKKACTDLPNIGDIGNLTHFFLETGINPLLHMDETPKYYLGGEYSKYIDPGFDLIPNNIISIGDSSFENLWWDSFHIPSNVVKIMSKAFYNSYIPNIYLNEGLKLIDRMVFAHSSLEEISIPNSVEELGFRCFYDCADLRKVTIGSNVKDLKNNQFCLCMNLKDVTYRGTTQQLKEILGDAFADCYELKEIKCTDGVYKIQ